MKKFLILTSVILSVFCINLSYADCGPDDQDCKQVWSGPLTGHCNANDTVGTDCTTRHPKYPTRVSKAACEQGNASSLTCAAKCCKDPYYLVLKDGGRSQGICYSETEAINFCKRCKEGNCAPVFEDRNINGCTQHVFVKCTKTTASTPQEPDNKCTLGFDGSPHVIQSVDRGLSSRSPTKSSVYTNTTDQNISNIHDLHLFDLTTVDGQYISTIPNFFDPGVNVSDLRTAIEAKFLCNTGNPKITIISPSQEENPAEETFTCELQFDNNTTITNVAMAESIKPNSAHSVQLWKMDANRTDTQSAYADENNSTLKQNYSSSASGYDADTPHLFNLKGITRTSSKGTTPKYYSIDNPQQLKDALYVKFTCKECDKGQCFEFDNVATIPTLPSVTFKCTSRTQCSELDVFTELDKYLNMEYFTQEPSVWINTQGKFNTARLASDSIAGVVLGTVGGIVTSKIIKKNQIKNGFEDLKCTIGGQDVATYGDEFTVGVK